MGGHFFGLDLVVKLHGVGKTFLYLNVSVSMVDGALLLFESDGRLFIMICLHAKSSSPVVVRPPGFRLWRALVFHNIFDNKFLAMQESTVFERFYFQF